MPQIFQVLRCYKCEIFQIHQRSKKNKWICKICGEKQSIKRHYGIGTGKECRFQVQKLNKLQSENNVDSDISDSEHSDSDLDGATQDIPFPSRIISKWSNYIEENDIIVDPISVESREKEEQNQTECKNSIVNNIELFDNKSSVMNQDTQRFQNVTISKPVMPSCTNQMHSVNNINKRSKWAEFAEFSLNNTQYSTNNSQQDAIFIHGDNICKESKLFNKELVNSSSKWNDFLDTTIDKPNIANNDSNLSCNKSNNLKLTVKENCPTKDKMSYHITKTDKCNFKPSDAQATTTKTILSTPLFFSITEDTDFDNILDF